jgi:hypothetical protein
VNLEISAIPHGDITYLIPKLLPHLPKSAEWSLGRSDIDDIVAFLYSSKMILSIVYDADTNDIHGYVICEVKQYPQFKMLLMQYCAGETGVMEQVEEQMHRYVETLAKALQCAGVEFVGRPGWKRTMLKHGYSANTVVYEKFFEGA